MTVKAIFFAMPCSFRNPDLVGGQVTAANGLVDFLKIRKVKCNVFDTAVYGLGFFKNDFLIIKAKNFLLLLKESIFERYSSALFFKSTLLGLFERFFPALIFDFRGVKVCLFFRNSEILHLRSGSFKEKAVQLMLRPYSTFFVQGQQWEKRLIEMGVPIEKIVIIPNWLPPGFKLAVKAKDAPEGLVKFVFTGRLVENKGIFEILEALDHPDLIDRCQFVFAGDGPDVNRCKQIVYEKGLNNVFFVGSLATHSVKTLLEESDVFVFPSYYEGFPNSVLEALAQGLPVITTDVGALSESIRSGVNGTIIPPRSAESVRNAMISYINNPSTIAMQSLEALKVVEIRHNRERNCELLLESLY
ncbi:Glycosyltransferase involved in cell wall bisynthesis [Vreelandella subterranea]|uniref:Glycosyltransferase involved in cell wall bisynthesis n=1 Tax=Vreelandella subterranea TaxID=416874 RepID=A0A1H9RRA6_9GAMM|nr:glycosyltransferase family 4 protein [Halomonas subterranea]SER75236.1 Glycosyltransferase involved in cell wall bisynthesis [Halomonas subterranea]